MPKTGRELDREVDEFLSAKAGDARGSSPLRFQDADVERMFGRRGSTGDSAKIAILGDPAYVRRFQMAKWNIRPSMLDTVDVALRHRGELGIPTSKHAHRLRADYFRALCGKFEAEHQRLLGEAARAYGRDGAPIAAGLREHWPSSVKERIRFAAQGSSTLGDAVRLHEALAKTRSPAFR